VILATTVAELDAALEAARAAGQGIGFVPTMGALHAGHLSLVEQARVYSDQVVVSIFVNPKQFGQGEDFDKYPRTLDADLAALDGLADVVFAPTADQVYPPDVEVEAKQAGPVGATFEGQARVGHFDGMLTVVARLFDLVRPNVAVFGEKDAQQLFLVRQLAKNEYPELRIIGAEIVREANGVAMSSRNRFLNAEQGDIAEILAITLATVSQLIEAGMDVAATLNMGRQMISSEPETKLEYLALVDPETFAPVGENFSGPAILLVAAIVGGVRLIDNHSFEIPA
jgi:pantoate--beta-alanine ligase